MISIIIPSFNEGKYLTRCVKSIEEASKLCPMKVEIIIAHNIKGIAKARNIGARRAKGDILVFLDADSTISTNFLQEVYNKSLNNYFVGGGVKYVKFDRFSIGRLCLMIFTGIYLIIHQITLGAFWVRREVYDELKGFNEIINERYEQIDFALRLKKYAKEHSKKFESIKESYITWDTRSFDKYGEWFWLEKYKCFQQEKIDNLERRKLWELF